MLKNFSEILRKFSVNFHDITILTKILKKLYANFNKTSGYVKICFLNCKEISTKCKIMFPKIRNFWKFWKKSDENSIRTWEIFCDFENILSRFSRISGKLFQKLDANFGEISCNTTYDSWELLNSILSNFDCFRISVLTRWNYSLLFQADRRSWLRLYGPRQWQSSSWRMKFSKRTVTFHITYELSQMMEIPLGMHPGTIHTEKFHTDSFNSVGF